MKSNQVRPSNADFSQIIVSNRFKLKSCTATYPKWHVHSEKSCSLFFITRQKGVNLVYIKSVTYDHSFTFSLNTPKKKINQKLRTYYKLLFVRESFERLLSAYKDKFVTNMWNWSLNQDTSKKIIQLLQKKTQ